MYLIRFMVHFSLFIVLTVGVVLYINLISEYQVTFYFTVCILFIVYKIKIRQTVYNFLI